MANSADPYLILHSAASDQGLHCFTLLSAPILWVIRVHDLLVLNF